MGRIVAKNDFFSTIPLRWPFGRKDSLSFGHIQQIADQDLVFWVRNKTINLFNLPQSFLSLKRFHGSDTKCQNRIIGSTLCVAEALKNTLSEY